MEKPHDIILLERLRKMTGNDPEFAAELIETYTEDTAEQLEVLEFAARLGQVTQAHEAAHRIKGASVSIGAVAMQLAAAELERCPPERLETHGLELVERLKARFGETRSWLDAYINRKA